MGNRVTVAGAARLAALALVLVALAAVSGPATPAPAQGGDRAPAAAPARDDGVIPAIGMPPVIPLSFDGDVRTLPQLPPKPYHLW